MTSPAMGTITFSDRFCIMLKMFAFHPCGVLPTSAAMVPTFSFTSPNIVERLPLMAPIRISFIHSLIASSMLCIGSYPRLTEQAGKQRYKDSADKGNTAACHELFYPQLGVKLCSMAGGGVQKIYMVFLREPSRRDRSGSDLFHLRDGFEIKMNFDRNVSCFIFVNALMHDDFFD